jgi:hypothetical protein
MTVTQARQNPDGGREMSIAFGAVLPFLILGIASLIYWKTNSPALHIVLLVVVTIPTVWLASRWISEPFLARSAEAGGWIYKDSQLKAFVAAISDGDSKRVRELAPRVDVNASGDMGITPLKFAIDKTANAGDKTPARLEMIRLLLSLGAKPDTALPNACASNNSETTKALLDAGADPNYKDVEGTPAFFSCLATYDGARESLRLLAAKGTDFNARDAKGEGVLTRAATFSAWPVVLYFVDLGVKDVPSPNGKTLSAMVMQALADDKQNSRETSPALKELAAKLQLR